MPLRRTQRSDGRQRPRWKDGSHDLVEDTHANESRCNAIALQPTRKAEQLVTASQLLARSHELLGLARMIAATVLRMWKDEEEYDPGRAGPPTKTREG